MSLQPYIQLARYKQWADQGLYTEVSRHFERLGNEDGAIVLRILDHIHVVDRIFQRHLQNLPSVDAAPRSEILPDLTTLAASSRIVDDWFATYVAGLSERELDQRVDFTFTSGRAARMRRGEIILHVCLHGTYHRGNAGLILQKNGVSPNNDRMTDFLEEGV